MKSPFFMSMLLRKLFFVLFVALWVGACHSQRVFMTGDSHVNSKIYPLKVEEILRSGHPDIDFNWWAKNGICFYSYKFNPEYYDSIFSFRPDILIVHLGTNGAYDTNFTRASFRQEIKAFYDALTDSLPDVKVVFVTPFTNKRRKYKKKGNWRVNYKNRYVAEELSTFVSLHPNTYLIDNNAEAGMMFLKSKGLIRRDNVHLTEAGYNLLGEQVGTDLLKIESLWSE